MDLPEFERVIYRRNPLVEVVCQLRFPAILKIPYDEPVEFQDAIRHQYPHFEAIRPPVPPEILGALQQLGMPFQTEVVYSFKSEDQKWTVSLARNFIAIKTSAYERYEQFRQRLEDILEIFEKLYQPSFYARVGLRYQDLVMPSKLGLEDVNWSKLIAPHIASELHDPVLSSSIQTIVKRLLLQTDIGQVNFNHGLVSVKEEPSNRDGVAYLFDADFFTEQKIEGNGDVWNVLDQFNKSARNLFRWSITDELHNAMLPQSVDSV